ncbi:gamma-glutamylcyclotransferase family protein [Burkholderia cepacia]|uniref:gamma-glutamylcyclotransferase family protein n=1 Tax=Burkholderia cepacia TaxID=292 RepID=UPI00075E2672|nr:gamma-glutamylcyclotransferase family protein [Burkholderia cepacia]OUE43420.1 UDP-N-acetylmuramate--alanine ligase [Burkholderia territorii]KVF61191.1 UDP-N-acetylmuramate--alanine ligase [Burkholderia cepacia]KVS61686.1 UDP-N-acetylmuramate--alanine ligase [Burkholderia cepacia]KWC92596.1 UDP-N-acetylmuramate--alanine ligase [Burkholderia cepacia]MDC6097980.1 gamma-glutamylcyclotransferase [Burkholderia cepacia]
MSSTAPTFSEHLFSYGTLQLEPVQLATFGRKLDGREDAMPGYAMTMLKIDDPEVVATSGKTHHPVVAYTGRPGDRVTGTVFAITREELQHADDYEVDAYRRDRVVLESGVSAWVYVDAGSPRPE